MVFRTLGRALRGGRRADDAAEATARTGGQARPDATSVNSRMAGRVNSKTQRGPIGSAGVGMAKWSAAGAAGYAGATGLSDAYTARQERQEAEAEQERFSEFMSQREAIMQSEMSPEQKREEIERLREVYEVTTATADDGILGGIFEGLGILDMFAILLVLLIIMRVAGGSN